MEDLRQPIAQSVRLVLALVFAIAASAASDSEITTPGSAGMRSTANVAVTQFSLN